MTKHTESIFLTAKLSFSFFERWKCFCVLENGIVNKTSVD